MILERLLTDGPALDLLDIFRVDLNEFDIRLSILFRATDSIEQFWAIPSVEFNELTIDVHVVIDEWFNVCGSENLLRRLIDLKQRENTQVDLARVLVLLKQRCEQEPAIWLAIRDIGLLVDVLSNSKTDDVLTWAIFDGQFVHSEISDGQHFMS